MITMGHNTNSNRKKRKTKKIKLKKYKGQKNTDLILLHQATHNSCIIDIISCISNIGTHLSPFLTSMSSLIKLAFALTASSILFNQLSYIHLTFDITFGLNATSAFKVTQLLLKTEKGLHSATFATQAAGNCTHVHINIQVSITV